MVFLPGISDVLEDFELNRFVETVRTSARPADIVVADLHAGYYFRSSVLERLHEDVIAPAKAPIVFHPALPEGFWYAAAGDGLGRIFGGAGGLGSGQQGDYESSRYEQQGGYGSPGAYEPQRGGYGSQEFGRQSGYGGTARNAIRSITAALIPHSGKRAAGARVARDNKRVSKGAAPRAISAPTNASGKTFAKA